MKLDMVGATSVAPSPVEPRALVPPPMLAFVAVVVELLEAPLANPVATNKNQIMGTLRTTRSLDIDVTYLRSVEHPSSLASFEP